MAVIPTITIFVRHSADCLYRDDEFHKGCKCRKHLRWFADGQQHRVSAKTRSWSEAETKKRAIEAGFSGGSIPSQETSKPRTTLAAAIANFVASKQDEVSGGVIGKYKRELERLLGYFDQKGMYFPSDMTLDELNTFRAGWKDIYKSPTTRQMVQARLRGFLSYCFDAGHIDRIPRLKSITPKDSPTLPLTDAQYEALLAAVPKSFTNPQRVAKVRALIRLMRHTGLAIQDASTLQRSEILYDKKKGVHRIETVRQKTKTHVSVPLEPDVAKEVLAVLNGNPKYVFWNGTGREDTGAKFFGRDLRRVFDKAGLPSGHPHQLRDTYAVKLLEDGVPLPVVSRALGHESIKTTERYYAKWSPKQQDRLDTSIMGTWGAK